MSRSEFSKLELRRRQRLCLLIVDYEVVENSLYFHSVLTRKQMNTTFSLCNNSFFWKGHAKSTFISQDHVRLLVLDGTPRTVHMKCDSVVFNRREQGHGQR